MTRAEEIQYNLEHVNEGVSEKISIILQGLLKEFEIVSNVAKCSRDEKSLDELKRDLVNFDSERQVIEKEMLLIARTEFVLNVIKEDVLKQCSENLGSRRDSEDKARKFQCKEFGHIAKFCEAKKNFISKTEWEQQYLAAETDAVFSFLSSVSPGEDLVVDSGATSNLIKDREMFVSLDENFKGLVTNVNFPEVRFRVKDEKGELKLIELKDTLYVPKITEFW